MLTLLLAASLVVGEARKEGMTPIYTSDGVEREQRDREADLTRERMIYTTVIAVLALVASLLIKRHKTRAEIAEAEVSRLRWGHLASAEAEIGRLKARIRELEDRPDPDDKKP